MVVDAVLMPAVAQANVTLRAAVEPDGTRYVVREGWSDGDGEIYVRGRVADPTPTPVVMFIPLIRRDSTLPWETIFEDGFESEFPGEWELWSEDDEYDWGKRGCRRYSGGYSAWAVGGGPAGSALSCGSNYPNGVGTWMIYGPFSLADASAAELTFDWWTDTPNDADWFFWGASTDGLDFSGGRAFGDQSKWTRGEMLDLSAVPRLGNLLGRDEVWVAFVFSSDSSGTDRGSFIDNVLLRKQVSGGAARGGVEGEAHGQSGGG